MNDYFHVRFEMNPCLDYECDILSALLCDEGYETFTTDETGMSAYIKKELYNEDDVKAALNGFDFSSEIKYTATLIEGEDWNKTWEQDSFKPIVIGDECVIHGSAHTDYPKAKYDMVINPKMSFGSGHHQTTTMMLQRLLKMLLEGKSLMDVGTGTGILAIMAAMRGATNVVGVEIEPAVCENAVENAAANNHSEIEFRCGGAEQIIEKDHFDYLLANINRNIILNDFKAYADSLRHGGMMILSGFFVEDVEIIEKEASKLGLKLVSTMDMENWANMCLEKA